MGSKEETPPTWWIQKLIANKKSPLIDDMHNTSDMHDQSSLATLTETLTGSNNSSESEPENARTLRVDDRLPLKRQFSPEQVEEQQFEQQRLQIQSNFGHPPGLYPLRELKSNEEDDYLEINLNSKLNSANLETIPPQLYISQSDFLELRTQLNYTQNNSDYLEDYSSNSSNKNSGMSVSTSNSNLNNMTTYFDYGNCSPNSSASVYQSQLVTVPNLTNHNNDQLGSFNNGNSYGKTNQNLLTVPNMSKKILNLPVCKNHTSTPSNMKMFSNIASNNRARVENNWDHLKNEEDYEPPIKMMPGLNKNILF